MPLVKRKVSPVRLARRPPSWGTTDSGEEVTLRGDYDLTSVTNVTLCGALRQLASLVTAAQDVSQELQKELGKINVRSSSIASRLAALEVRVAAHNPRAVPVREYSGCEAAKPAPASANPFCTHMLMSYITFSEGGFFSLQLIHKFSFILKYMSRFNSHQYQSPMT